MHLLDRDGRYSARVAVPKALHHIVGKRELLQALGPDRTLALRALPAAVAAMQATLEAARAQLKGRQSASAPARRGKPLTPQQMALQHYRTQVAFDQEVREEGRGHTHGFVDEFYAEDLKRAASGAASNEELQVVVGRILDLFRFQGHTKVTADDPDFRKAAMALAVAELESLRVVAARDDGDVAAATSHPLLKEEAPLEPVAGSPRIIGPDSTKPLKEVLAIFAGEKGSRPGTVYEYEVAVRMFEEFLGEQRPVCAITRQDVLGYKRALMETPANYTKRFPNSVLPEAIKLNKARAQPFPVLNTTTINDKWLARLHSILKWCVSNDVIPDNPSSGIKVEQVKAASASRTPFTPGDLTKIFAPPLFEDGKPYGERHWMALIALHTGFRASEIAQLKLDSIRHERGVLVFAVEEETKNRASVRLTPVHSTLIRLGLEKRVAALRAKKETRLFPEWYGKGQALMRSAGERKVNQPYSQIEPRWFNRTYLPSVGIHDDRKVFHCFRHTLKTALARAGVPRSISDEITGHDDRTAGAKYVHETSVEAMRDALEKIQLDGFSL